MLHDRNIHQADRAERESGWKSMHGRPKLTGLLRPESATLPQAIGYRYGRVCAPLRIMRLTPSCLESHRHVRQQVGLLFDTDKGGRNNKIRLGEPCV